jgi:ABC-2 type transport system ATP-binding protein
MGGAELPARQIRRAHQVTPTIELSGLEVTFSGRRILHSLNGAARSRAIGLLGPNGAGKSTLINTLLGFHPPSSGTARVLGLDIRAQRNELRALVGYMPENDAFIARSTGIHFVRYMAEISGLPPDLALERAHEAFVYVGLGEARYRPLGTYSLGMKQLAKLAQAIVHGPRLLILDEPTNGLDPPGRKRLIGLIRDIRQASDTHLLLSSHLLHDVEQTCEEVIILREGRIAAILNLEEERRANRRFLEMDVAGAGTAFTSELKAMGCECAAFGATRLKVVLPPGVEIRDVYHLAAQQDVRIRRLNYRRDSLEDLFLNAVEHAGASNGRL